MTSAAVKNSEDLNTANISFTRDSFHRGNFEILQRDDGSHRSGMDAMLIAACLPEGANGKLVDLGSATGAAGFAALSANPGLSATMVEIDSELVQLGQESLALSKNAHFRNRARFLNADVSQSGLQREAAGLLPSSVDFAICNPPYNTAAQRPSPNTERALAHVIGKGGLDSWMRTASAVLKPAGMLTLIYRTEKIGEIIACSQGRFGNLKIVPVHSKPNEPAKRVLVRAIKGSKAPLTIMPGIVMHDEDGKPTDHAQALINGEKRVHFDG